MMKLSAVLLVFMAMLFPVSYGYDYPADVVSGYVQACQSNMPGMLNGMDKGMWNKMCSCIIQRYQDTLPFDEFRELQSQIVNPVTQKGAMQTMQSVTKYCGDVVIGGQSPDANVLP